jgi:hypothetical protein
MASGPIKISD